MSKKEYYDIFISYRREGGKEVARPLKSELERRGFRVFLDFDDLTDGKFDQRIMDAIDGSPVFMFILSPHALDRCVNEEDWVRKEIEYAIKTNRHIVPINPDRTFTGFPDNISEHLKEGLGQHQFSEIMLGSLFKVSIDKMVEERVKPVIKEKQDAQSQQRGATIHIVTDLPCLISKFNTVIGSARPKEDCILKLRKGRHMLEFISAENECDRSQIVYPVEDEAIEDFITVELIPIRDERIVKERHIQEEEERRQKEEAERKRQEAETLARKAQAEKERKKSIHEGHTFVDLGLSVKWATCNVGATTPEEYGKYYAWGEIEPKASYTEKNSKTYKKSFGDIGGNPSHDAARAAWGGSWRLPTKAELEELIGNCKWKWTTQGGKQGYQVTSKINGKSIFLPAAGCRNGSSLYRDGSSGRYWSSTPNESNIDYAYYLYFNSFNHSVYWSDRDYGFSVRPVVEL